MLGGERLFTLIAETRGSYIKCDEEILLKSRMDEARFCIRTKWTEKVEDTVKIMIEGVPFYVRITEDRLLLNAKTKKQMVHGRYGIRLLCSDRGGII